MHASNMRSSSRGKLGSQFRDYSLCADGIEKAAAFPIAFKEAPAKGINKEKDDLIVSSRQAPKDITWKHWALLPSQEE
jgi:hypothetical protein